MATAVAVRARPILFSGPMVRAILEGSKSQTRRAITDQPWKHPGGKYEPHDPFVHTDGVTWGWMSGAVTYTENDRRCPYGQCGDRLWVREAFRDLIDGPESDWASADFDEEAAPATYRHIRFEATPRLGMRFRSPGDVVERVTYLHETTPIESDRGWARMQRRPSIHMPRWACRLVLELTEVRVQRLQAISENDAIAEGVDGQAMRVPGVSDGFEHRMAYAQLWDSLNAKRGYGWDVNPWVWALSFRRAD